jgi:hypothetical protein
MATLRRPAMFWDPVRTWPALMMPAGAELTADSIVVPFPRGQQVLRPIDERGATGVDVIVLGPRNLEGAEA